MKVKLEELIKVRTGKLDANAANENGQYPFFTCSKEPLSINTYSYDCECVLVAGNGDLNVKYYNGKFDAYQRTYILETTTDKLYVPFLYYFMNKYVETLRQQSIGGVIKYIKLENITNAIINLPDFKEQVDICKRMDKVKGILNKYNTEITLLDTLIKARFVEMFGDINTNTKGWKIASMGDYITLLTDFSSNGSYKVLDSNVVMKDEKDYAWMVRTTDLENKEFIKVKYIDEKTYNFLEKSKLYGNEIIMCKIGSAGMVYLMPEVNKPASLGRNAFMIRFDDRINRVFLFYLLNTPYGKKEIMSKVRGAVTKTITKDDARCVKILVPPKSLQDEYETFVEKVGKAQIDIKLSLDKVKLLFNSLMQKYFT